MIQYVVISRGLYRSSSFLWYTLYMLIKMAAKHIQIAPEPSAKPPLKNVMTPTPENAHSTETQPMNPIFSRKKIRASRAVMIGDALTIKLTTEAAKDFDPTLIA